MKNNERNSRKRLNSLILLVAFTAVMLIVSTYAWFSTQKNVTLGNLQGKVNVAEGLQISLDAKNWVNEIDLSADGIETYFAQTNADYNLDADEGDTILDLTHPYITKFDDATGLVPETFHTNTIPGEFLPASTIGSDSIGQSNLTLYRGENEGGTLLSNIHAISSANDREIGYYAIDFFIQNSTGSANVEAYEKALTDKAAAEAASNPTLAAQKAAEAKTYEDDIKLYTSSGIVLNTASKNTSGLQNTFRTAFVLFENSGDSKVKVASTPTQTDILAGTKDKNVKDVSIWEQNASGNGYQPAPNDTVATTGYPAHVDYVYQNNNKVTFSAADKANDVYTGLDEDSNYFTKTGAIPTYALTAASVNAKYTVVNANDTAGIKNLYNWAITDTDTDGVDDVTGLAKQLTVQTSTDGVTAETPLYSAKDGTTTFSLAPGQYHKLRLFVWLEGQDVDCINWASLGGDVTINVGLSKAGTQGS